MSDPVYEPAEDSELLASVVAKYASGRALDIGTGSGYLASVAHEHGCTVVAVDANPAVISRLRGAPFRVLRSDRFSAVRGTFDTIICNPPYLPNDEELHDPALHGGPKGYEYIVSVISDASRFLSAHGQFLFLISSLTKPAVIEDALKKNGFAWTIVAREKLFMEELLVYRATLVLGVPATLLGEGWRGRVYGVNATTAVKISTSVRARKEAQFLKSVNKLRIGPKLISIDGDRLYMRRVTGTRFDTTFEKTTTARRKKIARAFLTQLFALDRAGIKKHELTRPGMNILVTKSDAVVMLDFEGASYATRPGNVPQACAYFERVLCIEKNTLRAACAVYKKAPTPASFRAVLRALGI